MGSVVLNTKSTLLRYISEWDPRETAHTKGGYIDGEIQIPNSQGRLLMNIQTYPAADVEESVQGLHPCLLHAVRMGKGKRDQNKEPVPTHYHWQQNFLIEGGKVKIINKMSNLDRNKDDSLRNVPDLDTVTELHGNSIVMGRKRGELNLIILQPKQRNRVKNNEEATLTTVLANRMKLDVSDPKVEAVEKLFKGKKGQNLKRIRLRVDFYNGQGERVGNPAVSHQTIIDTGSKEIGCMDFYDASPHKSCVNGGRKIIMVSEYNLSKNVTPIFQVYDQEGCLRNDMEVYVKQPDVINVKNQTIIFITPEQKELHHIKNHIGNFHLRLRALRAGDQYISEKYFNFRYVDHDETGHCMFCDYKVDSDEMVQIEAGINRAKPRQPKRVMNNTSVDGEGKKARLTSDDKSWVEQLSSLGSPPLNPHQQTYQQNRIYVKDEQDSGVGSPNSWGSPSSSNHHLSPHQHIVNSPNTWESPLSPNLNPSPHVQTLSSPNSLGSPFYMSEVSLSTNHPLSPYQERTHQQTTETDRSMSTSSVESHSQFDVDLLPLLNGSEPLMFDMNGQFDDDQSVKEVLGMESFGREENEYMINNDTNSMTFKDLNSTDMFLNMTETNGNDPIYYLEDIDMLGNSGMIPSTVMNSSLAPLVSHDSISVIRGMPVEDSVVSHGPISVIKGMTVNLQRRSDIQKDGAHREAVGSQITDTEGDRLGGDGNKYKIENKSNEHQSDPNIEENILEDDTKKTHEERDIENQDDSFMEEIPLLIMIFIITFFILQILSDSFLSLPFFPIIILSLLCSLSVIYFKNKTVDLSS